MKNSIEINGSNILLEDERNLWILLKGKTVGAQETWFQVKTILPFKFKAFEGTFFGRKSIFIKNDALEILAVIANDTGKLTLVIYKELFNIQRHKSKACSTVLQLMDKDFSYQTALKKTLTEDRSLNKDKLEMELNHYI